MRSANSIPSQNIEQLAIGLVENGDDELVLGAKVVVDERGSRPRPDDVADAERPIAGDGKPPERGIEDLRLRLARLQVGKEARGAVGPRPTVRCERRA
jgi:hypothetical protein